MLSWLHCFSLYAAVLYESNPEKVKELWVEADTVMIQHSDNNLCH